MINTLLFPALKSGTCLNTASAGLMSSQLQHWRSEHDSEYVHSGSGLRLTHSAFAEELRSNLADLFDGERENTYLVPNFSFGFNILLDGLEKNLRFLLLAEDYPSINYPVTSRGFNHVTIPMSANIEAQIAEAIEKHRPDVFAFSLVQYISGIRLDPGFIRKIKADYPELLLIADGTQFCGTACFSMNNSGLDAVISSGYKWMLGGYGNGFAMLSSQLKSILYPVRKNSTFPDTPLLKGRDVLSVVFEPGHLDTLCFGSLNQSVRHIKSMGLENIDKANQDLCSLARTAFYERGLLPQSLIERKAQSTIMNLKLNAETVSRMTENKILFSERGAGSRISFHLYNTVEDLNLLLQVLDEGR